MLDEGDNPHRIFQSLNGTGRPLSQVDLIRNYFFMRLPSDTHEAIYRELWQPMQKQLGEERLTEFVRHYLIHFGSYVNEADVYATLKDRIERSERPVLQHLHELVELARYYAILTEPANAPPSLVEGLTRLKRLDVSVAYPFLLPTYADYARQTLSEGQLREVIDVIETFLIRRFVCGVSTQALSKLFAPLYQKAKRSDDFVTALKGLLTCPSDPDFRQGLISTPLYRGGDRRDKVKLLLERLDQAFGHKERIDTDNLTIEHVMPQTLTPAWQTELGETWEADHDALIHTLGNLTLTAYNAELSNRPFAAKQATYADSHLRLNRYFASIARWDADQIERRAETLADVALSLWPSFGRESLGEPTAETVTVTGTLPQALTLFGQRHEVRSWVEVLLVSFERFVARGPADFDRLAGALRRWVTRDPAALKRFRRPKVLSNGAFIETNLSARAVTRLCQQALAALGVSADTWQVERAALQDGDDDEAEATSELGELQLAFWEATRAKLMASGQFSSLRGVRAQNWYDVALGRSDVWLSLTASAQQNRIAVKLFVKGDAAALAMPVLLRARPTVEALLRAQLEWDPYPEKKLRSIRLSREADVQDRTAWPAAINWLCTTALAFRSAFAPLIETLP